MAQVLLSASSLLLIVTFFLFGKNLLLATTIFFVATIISTVISFIFRKRFKVEKKEWGLLFASIFFSGLTVFLKDQSYIMWRTTVINVAIGLGFFILYFFKKSPFEYIFAKTLEFKLPKEKWLLTNIIWGTYMFFCASVNTFIILMGYSEEIWMNVKTFVMPAITFIMMIIVGIYLYQEDKKYRLLSSEKEEMNENLHE